MFKATASLQNFMSSLTVEHGDLGGGDESEGGRVSCEGDDNVYTTGY